MVNYIRYKQDPYQRNHQYLQESNSKISFQSSTGQNVSQDRNLSDYRLRMDDAGSLLTEAPRRKGSLKHMTTCPEFSEVRRSKPLTLSLVKLKSQPLAQEPRLTLEFVERVQQKGECPEAFFGRNLNEAEATGVSRAIQKLQNGEVSHFKVSPQCRFERHVKSIPTLVNRAPQCPDHRPPGPGTPEVHFSRRLENNFGEARPFRRVPEKSPLQTSGKSGAEPRVHQKSSAFEYSFGTQRKAEPAGSKIIHRVRVIKRGVSQDVCRVIHGDARSPSPTPRLNAPQVKKQRGVPLRSPGPGNIQISSNLRGDSARPNASRRTALRRNTSLEQSLGRTRGKGPAVLDLNPYEYYDILRAPRATRKNRKAVQGKKPQARKLPSAHREPKSRERNLGTGQLGPGNQGGARRQRVCARAKCVSEYFE